MLEPERPDQPLLRSDRAPAPRTLVDILDATTALAPDAPAIDNGAEVLTYAQMLEAAGELADELTGHGIGRGDRVGIRIDSGTVELYVAVVGVLLAGAAYVPVDVDDPDERARTVFGEAAVAAVVGNGLTIAVRRPDGEPAGGAPDPEDDAWVIFTSGSTGTPKGVAVSHRNAAAFVDAEARLFCRDAPLGPGDRVMAGLSVAFDASCEEMWLAWRHGACLVPAPRSLVRSGTDLGPWLVANDVTVVSTVPTLVALWPTDALAAVRLLILGGEACPPEIGARLATAGREVWNTYGPTEATVVACAAQLEPEPPVRIGLPLDGWDLAVVDADGQPVGVGGVGELIIGGVGLARYLDPVKDAEKYAPMPTLGWDRAYRSGDVVENDPEGLLFRGRADDQVKVGGRRIELGELDSALLALPGVRGAAAAVRVTGAGNKVLVGYVSAGPELDVRAAAEHLRATMPAALVPRIAVVDTIPTRTSGKVDRDALPWPLPTREPETEAADFSGTAARLRDLWQEILGATPASLEDDFFDLGGGSLTAAQLVARLRDDHPEVAVADIYEHPTVGDLSTVLDRVSLDRASGPAGRVNPDATPVSRVSQACQVAATVAVRMIAGLRWLVWGGLAVLAARSWLGWTFLPDITWWAPVLGWLLLVSPPGRVLLSAGAARLVLLGVQPGRHPRGGSTHLRVWLAERLTDELGATGTAAAPMMTWYARLLGCSIGKGVDLHTFPPVTGLLTIGAHSAIEAEVDLAGHWVDGSTFHLGAISIGKRVRVGARSTLADGSRLGDDSEIGPGSAVFGEVPAGEYWSGAPAGRVGPARGPAGSGRAPRRPVWIVAYALTGPLLAALPVVAFVAGVLAVLPLVGDPGSVGALVTRALLLAPLAAVVAGLALAALVLLVVRVQSRGLEPGIHAVHGPQAWRAWTVVRAMDEARSWLFPLYSSFLTPQWLRLLGAKIGADVEASTVLMVPSLTSVGEGAFLADDTMLGMYELGGGWLRVERVKIGRRAFVGNSGMTAPGRKVPKGGLVAVLSAAPRRASAKAGTSWLGSPPTQLRRARGQADPGRTWSPPRRTRGARAAVEVARWVPVWVSAWLVVGVAGTLLVLADGALGTGGSVVMLLAGPVLAAGGVVAAAVTTLAKWLLVGRVRAGDHPLWSSFVWRNELADTFVEVVAAPWFARHVVATPVLNAWMRSMGARIGRGVWCDTYWLPETDLVRLDDGSAVNRGCVVQTHLFHDRILSMDTVTVRSGGTLGPHGVVLPAAQIGAHATVGPVSLVMRGESIPKRTRWIGNPVGPWTDDA